LPSHRLLLSDRRIWIVLIRERYHRIRCRAMVQCKMRPRPVPA